MARLTGKFLDSLKNRHSVVLGITRSGKTHFAGHALVRLQEEGVHTIFVDPKHDRDYENLGEVCHTPIEVYSKLLAKCPRIIFRTSGTKEQNATELDRMVELMFQLQRTPGYKRIRRVIAIDEIQLFVKKGGSRAVEMLWTIGAGLGIIGMALTQRMQLLNETCWSQSDNKVAFRIDDNIDYLKRRNLEHYPREFFNDDMNDYWFYYTTGGGKWKKHEPVSIDNPKRKGLLKLVRW